MKKIGWKKNENQICKIINTFTEKIWSKIALGPFILILISDKFFKYYFIQLISAVILYPPFVDNVITIIQKNFVYESYFSKR